MPNPNFIPKGCIGHKQLAKQYGVHPDTLKKEIKQIKGLRYRSRQFFYWPNQLKLIYQCLGNPFEE